MSVFKRGKGYYIGVHWPKQGWPRLARSCDTTDKAVAKMYERDVFTLRSRDNRALFEMLANGTRSFSEVHRALEAGTEAELLARPMLLQPLLEEWYTLLPTLVNNHGDRYSPTTITRYRLSWTQLLRGVPEPSTASLSLLTREFFATYHRTRLGAGATGATINRDCVAVAAFLRWCRQEKGLNYQTPKMPRERESRGRQRWLTAAELDAFEAACVPQWWPFFATLFYTGLRYAEAAGLTGADINFTSKRIHIRLTERRIKSAKAARDVGISEDLAAILRPLVLSHTGLIFPEAAACYETARAWWHRTCAAAKIEGATMHDARHTFAVHAVMNGVTIERLQKLLGHTTILMAMRYATYSNTAFLDQDAETIALSLSSNRRKDQLAARRRQNNKIHTSRRKLASAKS